jgi:hypothetical protein
MLQVQISGDVKILLYLIGLLSLIMGKKTYSHNESEKILSKKMGHVNN